MKNTNRKVEKISDILEGILEEHKRDRVTFGDLVKSLHERGFGFLMIIFTLPNCVPIPVPPGVSTIISLPLLFLSFQMVMGQPQPWFPKWLKRKNLSRKTLIFMINKLLPKLRWIEAFLQPRLNFYETKRGEQFLGFICLLFAMSVAIPLPMTNFLPGFGILIVSIGLIAKDGLMAIAGIIVGFIGLVVTSFVLIIGPLAVISVLNNSDKIFEFISSYFK